MPPPPLRSDLPPVEEYEGPGGKTRYKFDGKGSTFSAQELEALALMDQLQGHASKYYEKALKEDPAGTKKRLEALGDTSSLRAFGFGGMHGFSHGFSDDAERKWWANEGFRGKYESITGNKFASEHVKARTQHPIEFGLGQLLGGATAGYGFRGSLNKGLGPLRRNFSPVERQLGHLRGSNSMSPSVKQKLDRVDDISAQWSRVFLPTERSKSIALDALHGGFIGYGGFDVYKDEDAFSGERALRSGVGSVFGAVAAPPMLGIAGGLRAGAEKAAGHAGLRPKSAAFRTRLDVSPEEALRRAMSQDEFSARGPRMLEGRMDKMDAPKARRAGMLDTGNDQSYLRGVVDLAAREPAGARAILPETEIATGAVGKRASRLAEVEGGAGQVRDILAPRLGQIATDTVEQRLGRVNVLPPKNISPSQEKTVQAMMQAFDAGDAAVAKSWGARLKKGQQFALDDSGYQMLRYEIGKRIRAVFDQSGPDGLVRWIQDPSRAAFFNLPRLKSAVQYLKSGGQSGRAYNRLQEVLDAVNVQTTKTTPRLPQLANRRDQLATRYPLSANDAAGIASAARPKSGFEIPGYVKPMDPAKSPPMLKVEIPKWSEYGAHVADRVTLPFKFGSKRDMTPGETNMSGALSTGAGMQIEERIVSPIVEQLMAMGYSRQEAHQLAIQEVRSRMEGEN